MQKGRNKTASAILLGGEVANIFYLFWNGIIYFYSKTMSTQSIGGSISI